MSRSWLSSPRVAPQPVASSTTASAPASMAATGRRDAMVEVVVKMSSRGVGGPYECRSSLPLVTPVTVEQPKEVEELAVTAPHARGAVPAAAARGAARRRRGDERRVAAAERRRLPGLPGHAAGGRRGEPREHLGGPGRPAPRKRPARPLLLRPAARERRGRQRGLPGL